MHLHRSHAEQHRHSRAFLSDVVIGMSDGLTVPFALAAGLSGAAVSTGIIITAGLAEIAAGSIAMGLGGFLAGRTEQEHYHSELLREQQEVEQVPEEEKKEVRDVFAGLGLSPESQELIANEMARDKQKWVDFMMRFELGLEKPDPRRALRSALNIGGSYILGGLVPLSPYFFYSLPLEALRWSCIITVLCLFIFGYFKAKATGSAPWSGAIRVMLIGSAAAGAAFLIARIFAG
ncbi:MAG: VIT1/CCC1 transporter family protein [Bacteroidetes bacterium]|nr:VIT1/CCC1 transporter family protein [Bacteroidota bacterium]MBS1628905.1 VIT1/CCC1 transporter family protein [Bacteroidota bacterium]